MGYHRAGFDVVGVDLKPQPRYPFEFHQFDAMDVGLSAFGRNVGASLGREQTCRLIGLFDAIHASPPCHAYSTVTGRNRHNRREYPDLVSATRDRLEASGVPWVIENVPGAPLHHGVVLCGSMFGLDVRRHRVFESSVAMLAPECRHHVQKPRFRSLDMRTNRAGRLASVVGVHGHLNYPGEKLLRERAMGIDWMGTAELSQAIPPAYTEFIGRALLAAIGAPP